MPKEDVLLKYLEIEWQDHFQTRTQTWRTLEIVAALVVAMIGIDWQVAAIWPTVVAAILVVLGGLAGALITKHHRDTERRKFDNIILLEEELERGVGIQFFSGKEWIKRPMPLRWRDLFNPTVGSTPMFIFRMHVVIIVFGFLYGLSRLIVG